MRAGLVVRCSSQPFLALAIGRHVYTFISYQGQCPSSDAVQALDSEPLTAIAIFGENENPSETGWVA
jgi:hypothetical protein